MKADNKHRRLDLIVNPPHTSPDAVSRPRHVRGSKGPEVPIWALRERTELPVLVPVNRLNILNNNEP